MTTYYVSSGQTSSGIVLFSGDSEYVLSGGTASATTIGTRSTEVVSAGGTSLGDLVSGVRAVQDISGQVFNAVVERSGQQIIYLSGSALSTTLKGGGIQYVSGGAEALDTLVQGGSTEYIESGYFLETSNFSGMIQGGVASASIVFTGGEVVVESGGIAADTVISQGGLLQVNSAGSAEGAQIDRGGTLSAGPGADIDTMVSSGGTVIDSFLVSGGQTLALTQFRTTSAYEIVGINLLSGSYLSCVSANVLSGGLISMTAEARAYDLEVQSGGTLIGSGVLLGSSYTYYGSVEGGNIDDGLVNGVRCGIISGAVGDLTVNGVSVDVQLENGTIYDYGLISNTDINNGGVVYVYGASIESDILSGGTEYVVGMYEGDGGGYEASFTNISSDIARSGGVINLDNAVRAKNIVVDGGALNLNGYLCSASGTTVSGGLETIYHGIELGGLVEAGGRVDLTLGGDSGVVNLVVGAGGTLVLPVFAASAARGVVVSSGGDLTAPLAVKRGQTLTLGGGPIQVTSDTSLLGVEVLSGGLLTPTALTISAGGVVATTLAALVSNTTVLNGGVLSGPGTLVGSADADAGILSGLKLGMSGGTSGDLLVQAGGVADGLTVYDGVETISGSASATTLTGAAEQDVYGTSDDVILSGGGRQIVYNGITSNVAVRSGGLELVSAGAEAEDIRLLSGGSANVGGVETGVTVGGGAILSVYDGSASEITVGSGGIVFVEAPAQLSGVTVMSGGELHVLNGATIAGLTLMSGALEISDYIVAQGQTSSGIAVGSGGSIRNAGLITDAVVNTSGVAYDLNAGSSFDMTVSAGGEELVAYGSIDSGATLVGITGDATPGSSAIGRFTGLQIVSGLATGAVVSSGGYQEIAFDGVTLSAGEALSTTVMSGGVVEVNSGAILSGAVLNSGAELIVYNRYDVLGDLTLAAGALIDLADQTVTAASIGGGVLAVSSGSQVIESFSLSGSTTDLGVSIASNGAGGSLLTVTSGGADAARPSRPATSPTGSFDPAAAMTQAAAAFGVTPNGSHLAAAQSAGFVLAFTLAGAVHHALA